MIEAFFIKTYFLVAYILPKIYIFIIWKINIYTYLFVTFVLKIIHMYRFYRRLIILNYTYEKKLKIIFIYIYILNLNILKIILLIFYVI